MKYLGLILLVFLLAWLQKSHAQTASTRPVTEFYSPLVKQKLEAGMHPVPSEAQDVLPGSKEVPQKVKNLGKNAHIPSGSPDKKKLPGYAHMNVQTVEERNKKFVP
jgi:hypothetical protein